MRTASINVSADHDAQAIAATLADLADQPPPTFNGDDWVVSFGETVRMYVGDDDPAENDGYAVNVDVQSSTGPDDLDRASRDVYDLLVRRTDWGLRLLNSGFAPIAQRPVASRAS